MEKDEKLLEGIVKQHIAQQNIEDEKMRELLEDKLIDSIRSAIIKEERTKMKKELLNEIQEEKDIEQINKVKAFIVEGFIIAFFVGLLVNQFTDIISIIKGIMEKTHLNATIVSTGILFLIVVVILVIQYIYTGINFLSKSNTKKKGQK